MLAFLKRLLFWKKKRPTKTRSANPLESASAEKVEIIRMGKKDVEVRSLPFGEYLEIATQLDNIPGLVVSAFTQNHDLTKFILAATDIAQDELLMIISQATGLDEDYIYKNVTPAQLLKYWKAFKTVNEYDFLVGEIKAAAAKAKGFLKTTNGQPDTAA